MKNVCILNGLHRGATFGIGDDPVLIGGDEDCKALLSDVSAESAAIRVSLDPSGDIVATAVRGKILHGARTLREGKRMTLTRGAVVRVGDVRIAAGGDLAIAERAVVQDSRRRAMLKWSGAGVVCVALVGAIGIVGGPADAFDSIKRVQSGSVISAMPQRDPLAELEREIARVDLSDVIQVDRDDQGRITASGAIDPGERARWRDVVRWFDGRFGSVTTLEARLAERDDDIVLPFRIVSVLAAPSPRVVIQNGNAFPVGSILPGGWEVRGIAQMKVVLARGDRELAISF